MQSKMWQLFCREVKCLECGRPVKMSDKEKIESTDYFPESGNLHRHYTHKGCFDAALIKNAGKDEFLKEINALYVAYGMPWDYDQAVEYWRRSGNPKIDGLKRAIDTLIIEQDSFPSVSRLIKQLSKLGE